MKKLYVLLLALCAAGAVELAAQEMGVGLDIRIFHDSDASSTGSTEIETFETSMDFGGSFHYFAKENREYIVSALVGSESSSNGVSEMRQTFFGLGSGANFHILRGSIIDAGLGARLGFTVFLEPEYDPDLDYDLFFEGHAALELPIFLDVRLHKNCLLRFMTIAAGMEYFFHQEEYEGIKETINGVEFYTTAASYSGDGNWIPVSISFVFKL